MFTCKCQLYFNCKCCAGCSGYRCNNSTNMPCCDRQRSSARCLNRCLDTYRMPGEVITSGSGTSTTISGLEPNIYTFIVRNATGCSSANSSNVTILHTAGYTNCSVVGQITQPSCKESTGSVVLSRLPATVTHGTSQGHREATNNR